MGRRSARSRALAKLTRQRRERAIAVIRRLWPSFGPITRARLLVIVGWAVVYLLCCIGGVVFVHANAPKGSPWPDAVRAAIPLLVALPVAVFTYVFPLRLHYIKAFGELRARALVVLASARQHFALSKQGVDDSHALVADLAELRLRFKEAEAQPELAATMQSLASESAALALMTLTIDKHDSAAFEYGPMKTDTVGLSMLKAFNDRRIEAQRMVVRAEVQVAGARCP